MVLKSSNLRFEHDLPISSIKANFFDDLLVVV